MKFIADFHIHSHFSVATSKELVPEQLELWARRKGIAVIGTGDFTHPGWVRELKEKLIPAEGGLFKLQESFRDKTAARGISDSSVRFMLTAEISSIYKKSGKVRKVHNVILAPDFEAVQKIQDSLVRIGGNITSDGRPILGLDSRDLLEIALTASEKILLVPAHIWTPWFSALGDKSGFDSIAECYDDLARYINTVETGLSSDPPMNWMCKFLDSYTLISNSDAHSPDKLGRNANVFDTDLTYDSIVRALKSGDPRQCLGTIDLFPQEGKYHFDGHRKCNICWNPLETLEHDAVCPVCGKKVTVGVMNRVAQLADRDDISERQNQPPFRSIIPLNELLSEILDCGSSSKKVSQTYHNLIRKAGSEFNLLLEMPVEEIEKSAGIALAEGIRRVRNREVYIKEGYDGEYGQIKVFAPGEKEALCTQNSFWGETTYISKSGPKPLISFDLHEFRALSGQKRGERTSTAERGTALVAEKSEKPYSASSAWDDLDEEQKKAVQHGCGTALVIAGPGTGKTRVLAYRIAHLIQDKGVEPTQILAVTFTNKAALEMRERLNHVLRDSVHSSQVLICTFHAFGYSIVKDHCDEIERTPRFTIIDADDREEILIDHIGCTKKDLKTAVEYISTMKEGKLSREVPEDSEGAEIYVRYEDFLRKTNSVDLDDLISLPIRLFSEHRQILDKYRTRCSWILIDEYQDINQAQYRLVRMLMPDADSNLFVIGDPQQAIYGFRGADVRFIQQFAKDYPGAAVYNLTRSYRCSDYILRASSGVLGTEEGVAQLLDGLHTGIKIQIVENPTDRSEGEFIARTIEKMMGGLRFFSMDSRISEGGEDSGISSLGDFAVLCRIGAQMNAIEKAFRDHSIPYQTAREKSFFTTEPIRSIINQIRYMMNPGSDYLRNVGIKSGWVNPAMCKNVRISDDCSVKKLVSTIIDVLNPEVQDSAGGELRFLLEIASSYGNDLDAFLRYACMGTSIDIHRPNVEMVSLLTIHAAKGLEFSCVFIPGCEEGLLPYSLYKGERADIQEERRLLYVGMTRAKQYLFLTHARKRALSGREMQLPRSTFLKTIEEELIEQSSGISHKREEPQHRQLELF